MIVAQTLIASSGACAACGTRRTGLDFKEEGGTSALFFEIVPVWQRPLPAQGPPEASTSPRYTHG